MKEVFARVNYLVTGFVSILGFTMIYEVISEDDMMDKIDDALLTVLGIIAIRWYKKSGYKGETGVPAVVISLLAVATKVFAIAVEHADKEAVGDDIGILVALILLSLFVVWQVFFRKKIVK